MAYNVARTIALGKPYDAPIPDSAAQPNAATLAAAHGD